MHKLMFAHHCARQGAPREAGQLGIVIDTQPDSGHVAIIDSN